MSDEDAAPESANDAAPQTANDESVTDASTDDANANDANAADAADSNDESAGGASTDAHGDAISDVAVSDADAAPNAGAPAIDPNAAWHLRGILESLVFASDRPIKPARLARLARAAIAEVKSQLDALAIEYRERGVQLVEVGGGWQFRTHPANASFVREITASRPVRLSRAQMETLAIIAYRQPITRPELEDIRGVDSGSALKFLLEREVVKVLGRKEDVGRPLLYGTTPQFLEMFGLSSLRELPTLRELSELTDESKKLFEKRAGEPFMVDPGPVASAAEDVSAIDEMDPAERPTDAPPAADAESIAAFVSEHEDMIASDDAKTRDDDPIAQLTDDDDDDGVGEDEDTFVGMLHRDGEDDVPPTDLETPEPADPGDADDEDDEAEDDEVDEDLDDDEAADGDDEDEDDDDEDDEDVVA